MGNRKLPFGYRMEMGAVVVEPSEAELVRRIFDDYSGGASLKSISDSLNSQPVRYCEGKLWNKNMVARMLEDERYSGAKDFPAIVRSAEMEDICRQRRSKSCPRRQTEAQKVLRRLCGRPVTEAVEKQVLHRLNELISDPSVIKKPDKKVISTEAIKLQSEFKVLISRYNADEEAAKQTAMRLVAARYSAIGDDEYETVRLRSIFGNSVPLQELDAALLKLTVSAITVHKNGSIAMRLKNNQIIGRSES